MPNRIPTPGIPTPMVRKSTGAQPAAKPQLTGDAAIKAYQKEISPAGMAKSQANIAKAIDRKYPGLYKSAKK